MNRNASKLALNGLILFGLAWLPVVSFGGDLTRRVLPAKAQMTKNLEFSGEGVVLQARLFGGQGATFKISFGSQTATLTSPSSVIEDVQRVIRYGSHLIIMGTLDGHYSYANYSLVGLSDMSVKQSLDCFDGSISPDGKKLAYRRFFPMHFTEHPEDQAFVVDFDDLIQAGRSSRPSKSEEFSPYEVVGAHILSSPGEVRGRDNVLVPPNEAHHILSNFSWSPDSRVVGYLDQVGDQAPYLVTAALVSGRMEVKRYRFAFTRPLDRTWAIEWATPSTPRVVRMKRGAQGAVTRDAVGLWSPELVPQ